MAQEFSEEYVQGVDQPKATRLVRRTVHVQARNAPPVTEPADKEVPDDAGRGEIEQARRLERAATRRARAEAMEDIAWAHLQGADARFGSATDKEDGNDAYAESECVMGWMDKYESLVAPPRKHAGEFRASDDDNLATCKQSM